MRASRGIAMGSIVLLLLLLSSCVPLIQGFSSLPVSSIGRHSPRNTQCYSFKKQRLHAEPRSISDSLDKDDSLVLEAGSGSWCYWSTAYELAQAGTVGSITGLSVAAFKLSIEAVRSLCYEESILVSYPSLVALLPAIGGVVVGLLLLLGGPFPPGLRGTVQQVDDNDITDQLQIQGNFLRKSAAAVATLGTGASLGPEGPCVEIGIDVARACSSFNRPVPSREAGGPSPPATLEEEETTLTTAINPQRAWNRVLISCGAAAGVAAGFNAPLAGVFFALEIMQNTFQSIDEDRATAAAKIGDSYNPPPSALMTSTTTITPILLASVLSALTSETLLGNELVLQLSQFNLETPLLELPLYLLLGALSGVVAFVFTYSAKISQQFFQGDLGADAVKSTMNSIPEPVKPVIGGLICGLVGLAFPQILFFGYETLNSLLKNNSLLPVGLILSLLVVKTITTALSAGSGLVGGTFAPSLFLGAMLGGAFHDGVDTALNSLATQLPSVSVLVMQPDESVHIAGVAAYAMVGAASVLAALFRAPLTASLLLFEVTRNYDVILPLMASAGVGSIVGDILEDRLERRDQMQRRDKDPVSWGDLSLVEGPTVDGETLRNIAYGSMKKEQVLEANTPGRSPSPKQPVDQQPASEEAVSQ
ncbi:Chloride channel protein CLC-e [Seminavis robusta]|uniref:Chloride channel protein CLC-e n=1 Tax=Seminavis robusta TaxID=568900 RepID=A0A9N8HJD7_9STRA|nr:Chloride channel protein CLC-e [Seminavis robusta]|eukprot:Sro655_g182200.1 Chloride channel protein CLC-e (648) ;mRNA; f:4363-6306